MKKIFLASASIAAGLMGSQALAAAGYVGANYSSVDVEVLGVEGEGDGWGLEVSHSFATGPGLGFALDAGFADSDDTDSAFAATGHLFSLSEGALFGGFASFADSDVSSTWAVGGEAQAFLDTATIGGAVSYVSNDDADVDGWGINGAARFFASDNFAIGGNLGWFTLDSGGADADAIGYGVGAEYQLDSTPISFLANYSRYDADDADIEADAWTVGVRYNWGGTLKERDRNGGGLAGLSGVSALRF